MIGLLLVWCSFWFRNRVMVPKGRSRSVGAGSGMMSEGKRKLVKERILEILGCNNQHMDFFWLNHLYLERHGEPIHPEGSFGCDYKSMFRNFFSDTVHLIEMTHRTWMVLKDQRPPPFLQYTNPLPAAYGLLPPCGDKFLMNHPPFFRPSPSRSQSSESRTSALEEGRGIVSNIFRGISTHDVMIPAESLLRSDEEGGLSPPPAPLFSVDAPNPEGTEVTKWANWKQDLGVPATPTPEPTLHSSGGPSRNGTAELGGMRSPKSSTNSQGSRKPLFGNATKASFGGGCVRPPKLFSSDTFNVDDCGRAEEGPPRSVPKKEDTHSTPLGREKENFPPSSSSTILPPANRRKWVGGGVRSRNWMEKRSVDGAVVECQPETSSGFRFHSHPPESEPSPVSVVEEEALDIPVEELALALFQKDPETTLSTRWILHSIKKALDMDKGRFPRQNSMALLRSLILSKKFHATRIHPKTKDMMVRPRRDELVKPVLDVEVKRPPVAGKEDGWEWESLPLTEEELIRLDPGARQRILTVSLAQYYTPKLFYVVLGKNLERLGELSGSVKAFYETEESGSLVIPVEELKKSMNMVVAAPYHHYGYHRAEVKEIYDDGTANVFYVDYGTRADTAAPGQIRYLLNTFFRAMPAQAIQASINEVKPPVGQWEWGKETEKRFLELASHPVDGAPRTCHLILAGTQNGMANVHELIRPRTSGGDYWKELGEGIQVVATLIAEKLAREEFDDGDEVEGDEGAGNCGGEKERSGVDESEEELGVLQTTARSLTEEISRDHNVTKDRVEELAACQKRIAHLMIKNNRME